MTDVGTNRDDGPGDEPDTFDGRLEGITLLIDTLGDETDPMRRLHRQATILRLLNGLTALALERIAVQIDRLADT